MGLSSMQWCGTPVMRGLACKGVIRGSARQMDSGRAAYPTASGTPHLESVYSACKQPFHLYLHVLVYMCSEENIDRTSK